MTDKLSVADVLDRAATLIEPPEAWTQNAWARDGAGRAVGCDDPNAKCWCLDGALMLVKESGQTFDEIMAIDKCLPDGEAAINWNDAPNRTQSQVVSKLREAANLARERGL